MNDQQINAMAEGEMTREEIKKLKIKFIDIQRKAKSYLINSVSSSFRQLIDGIEIPRRAFDLVQAESKKYQRSKVSALKVKIEREKQTANQSLNDYVILMNDLWEELKLNGGIYDETDLIFKIITSLDFRRFQHVRHLQRKGQQHVYSRLPSTNCS
jgi:hypothetical protein